MASPPPPIPLIPPNPPLSLPSPSSHCVLPFPLSPSPLSHSLCLFSSHYLLSTLIVTVFPPPPFLPLHISSLLAPLFLSSLCPFLWCLDLPASRPIHSRIPFLWYNLLRFLTFQSPHLAMSSFLSNRTHFFFSYLHSFLYIHPPTHSCTLLLPHSIPVLTPPSFASPHRSLHVFDLLSFGASAVCLRSRSTRETPSLSFLYPRSF